MNNKNRSKDYDFITQIEKGKFKNKQLINVMRAMDVLDTGLMYGSTFLIPLITNTAMNGMVGVSKALIATFMFQSAIRAGILAAKQKVYAKYNTEFSCYTAEKSLEFIENAKGVVTEEIVVNDHIKRNKVLSKIEINTNLDNYINSYSNKIEELGPIWTNTIAAAMSLIGVGAMAYTNGNVLQTVGLLGFGLGSGYFINKYIKNKTAVLNKKFREASVKHSAIENDLMNKDLITNEDRVYNLKRLKCGIRENNKYFEDEKFLKNFGDLANNALFASMILGLVYTNFNAEITTLLTSVFFYTDVTNKAKNGLENFRKYTSSQQKYEQNLENVKGIVEQVKSKKIDMKMLEKEFSRLDIKDFKGVFYHQLSGQASDYRECSLNIPSLTLNKGESVLITGESGSGKTTIFKMLKNGDLNNKRGIFVDGEVIDGFGESSILYTPSMELNSYDNVLNIITCGKSLESLSQEEKEKLITICRGLSLDKSDELDIFRKRNILNDLDCKSFDEFSQGQKQRLVLAKILFLMRNNHQVMIFDEPTANLDKETSKKVFSFITEFCNRDRERMVILSSHETDIASRYVDKVYEISNGVLRERVKVQSDRERMQGIKGGEKESRGCKFELDEKCALEIEER